MGPLEDIKETHLTEQLLEKTYETERDFLVTGYFRQPVIVKVRGHNLREALGNSRRFEGEESNYLIVDYVKDKMPSFHWDHDRSTVEVIEED